MRVIVRCADRTVGRACEEVRSATLHVDDPDCPVSFGELVPVPGGLSAVLSTGDVAFQMSLQQEGGQLVLRVPSHTFVTDPRVWLKRRREHGVYVVMARDLAD